MTKVYIAAPWVSRAELPAIAAKFEAIGCEITHKWWAVEDMAEGTPGADDFLEQCAIADAAGVIACDILIVINSSKSEGKAVEQGIALGLGKTILIVGKRGEHSMNVFHYLSNFKWFETVEQTLFKVQEINYVYRRFRELF